MILMQGKIEDILRRLKEMAGMSIDGGGVIYEGAKKDGHDPVVVKCRIPARDRLTIENIRPEELDIRPSQQLLNHSPTGFSWGYSGSGPAQLSLAILLDATGDKETSLRYHQEFKERFVAGWGSHWRIHSEQVLAWVEMRKKSDQIKAYMRSLGDE